MKPLLSTSEYIIVGARFAGVATAWALSRRGLSGVMLEREFTFGVYASGRSAAPSKRSESDSLIASLAWRTTSHIRALEDLQSEILRATGGLTLCDKSHIEEIEAAFAVLKSQGVAREMLAAPAAKARFVFLRDIQFDVALWCPEEGVVDICRVSRSARALRWTSRVRVPCAQLQLTRAPKLSRPGHTVDPVDA